jgi:porin
MLVAAFVAFGATAASAADLEGSAVPPTLPAAPQTLTNDWFGAGADLRNAGINLRVEWSQFYQGLTRGNDDKTWQ